MVTPVEEVTVPAPPIAPHEVSSQELFKHASGMIARKDLLQASEKVWGSVAHALKAIGRARNWPLDSHADYATVADYVAEQVGKPEIGTVVGAVESLHRNFYDGNHDMGVVQGRLNDVARVLPLLDDAHKTLPLDLPAPLSQGYRDRHRVTFNALEAGLTLDEARGLQYHMQRHWQQQRALATGQDRRRRSAATVKVSGRDIVVSPKGGVIVKGPTHRPPPMGGTGKSAPPAPRALAVEELTVEVNQPRRRQPYWRR